VDLETADDMGVVGTGRYARVLRAQYRILKESEDDGSMGQTSEWFPCAVKVPLTDDPLAKQMVETEARILAHLQKTDEVPSPQFAPEERSQSLLPRGRDRIVKYIGLKELGGFLRRDVKSPAVSRQGSVRRKPRRDSRGHTRSVSDSTALKALAEQGNEESQHDRSERVAAFANSVTVDEGIGVGGTLPCLILEYLPRSLSAWLGDPSHTQLMGRERWRLWAMELCEAVAWCHSKGILHGDIKVRFDLDQVCGLGNNT
jgi:serine/threonine protein kinase